MQNNIKTKTQQQQPQQAWANNTRTAWGAHLEPHVRGQAPQAKFGTCPREKKETEDAENTEN